ncbi:hypothetical protein [Sphaerisporangium perillae]|uniref:hypothetical protein n=1 Tax=Sphaerisporangium perillae TaxID=2935860 RepID=UPI00200DC20D|nr:hypothetical protein [Sphaerisporangium perillae]
MPALVGAAVLLIASAIGYSATTRTGSLSPAPSASAPTCDQPPSRVPVRQGSGTIVFPEVSYAIDHSGDRPRIDLAGSYQGAIEEGKRVAVIVRADPGSHDSSPGRHPGDGRYYYERDLQLDEVAHCWTALSLSPAYTGSEGLLWHIYLVLVPADFTVMSVSARDQVEDGVFKTLEVLADFTVTT